MKYYNRIIDKGGLKKLIAWAYQKYGSAHCANVADRLKDLGFRYATKAGVSISVDDLQIPPIKQQLLEAAEAEINLAEDRYAKGEITEVERFQKVIDTWNSTSENLKEEVVRNFRETDPLNSVYMMAFSGARGNLSQVRQLVGMRGLMANPQGEIIALPIKTNFREGLTVTEYVISSYGARKGLVDTALRTADSGYLTRRLVDVSQDVIVREIDCGTQRGLVVKPMKDGDRTLIPLSDRLLGRILAEEVVDPNTGEVIAQRNQDIDQALAGKIGSAVDSVVVRSPLTCEAARSVCQHCYGWSLAHGKMVDLGEAVGIIAAQSIGEPGTQLTMRTFHTGGVFTGEVARIITAEADGKIKFSKSLATRRVRTRHGDERQQVEVAGDIILTAGKQQYKYPVPPGSVLTITSGDSVTAGQLLAEVTSAKAMRSTERATKDVASDLAGEVLFGDISPEDKLDRQGNITRIANRSGLLWVLSGEVYNLPPGAEPVVKNGSEVEPDSVIAETKLISNSGGTVRLTPNSREIEIITASVLLDQATIRVESSGSREQYIIDTADGQQFLLKAAPGTKVQNGSVIAELIDDRYHTQTGGIVKYADIEISKGSRKQGYEVTQGGTLLWIAEESHEVNKDISLLQVEDGQYIEEGTEVVKDIFSQSAGVVEVVQKNDILREIIIKPGKLHLIDDLDAASALDGQLVNPGEEILSGISTDELKYAEIVETTEGPGLLLRPVTEYQIHNEPIGPSTASVNSEDGHQIELRSVQRIFYKDGERVKSVDGISLVSTQLVLQIRGSDGEPVSNLSADIELSPDEYDEERQRLQLVILESLVVRRDIEADAFSGRIQNKVLVEDGQTIARGAVVANTEIKCKETGIVRGIREGVEAIRRILIVRDSDRFTIEVDNSSGSLSIAPGDLIVAGQEIADGIKLEESGQVIKVEPEGNQTKIIFRIARPYRVSSGAILHINDGDLVQRGDNMVLLVFERAKTGDIIQGLPRIEELLEARKPKDACILSRKPGECQVVYQENETVDVKIIEDDGTVSDYIVSPGQNVIVTDGQKVSAGEPLTDGLANPHEILEVFFNYLREQENTQGDYESALEALQHTQKFLVDQVQSVYQSQGIDISDKHIEVIVRQMTSKVRVDDGGDTTMLPGELVELRQIEQVNEAMSITGGAPAQYTPVLLGITKASLNTDSFISAASFQETTRVLTEAAIEGKSDWLRGLKENVIIGRLIPAGTGYNNPDDLSIIDIDGYSRSNSGVYSYESVSSGNEDLVGIPESNDMNEDVVLDDQTARAIASINDDYSSEASAINPSYEEE